MMDIYDELSAAYGNHFQDLFTKLMKEKYGIQYQSTSPYGNIGDRCVDGILNSNTAFAVYAPETYKDSNAIAKLKSDFSGFMEHKKNGHWKDIQEYIFVIKRERPGVTPAIFDLISEFNKCFQVKIMTLDDIKIMTRSYLPFSEDGRRLLEFKDDINDIMEYIVKTDFAAEPFSMSLLDDMDYVLEKWNRKQYSFQEEKIENLKNRIFNSLIELRKYLTPLYVHELSNGYLLFNNNSWEAGKRLRNELQPQTRQIRCKVRDLLEELYSLK